MTVFSSARLGAAIIACCLFGGTASAEFNVVGTGDGLEMLRTIALEYSVKHPEFRISIPPSIGSGGGVLAVSSGKERLGRVARPLNPSEVELGLEYIPIAKIPTAIFVNSTAGVRSLTSAQVIDVFSGRVRNWSELGGANLQIKVVRREEDDSSIQVLRATMPGWDDLVITEKSKTAVTTQDGIRSVAEVDGAIGFGAYSRALELQVDVLKIDGLAPTHKDYPSSVVLALIYKRGTLDDEAKSFVSYCLSDDAARVIDLYGGVPIRD